MLSTVNLLRYIKALKPFMNKRKLSSLDIILYITNDLGHNVFTKTLSGKVWP